MKTINAKDVEHAVYGLVEKCSFHLADGAAEKFALMEREESVYLSRETLHIIGENARIAHREGLPLCQDCGVAVVFADIGQNVVLEGDCESAIQRGVEGAYRDFPLRKSVVGDPLRRQNTGTNTPAFIHWELVSGDALSLTVYLKGGGSENMTSLKMFRPTDSVDAIIEYIARTVKEAGPNPCPPVFLGIGIGGTADVALVNAKKAVVRGVDVPHGDVYYAALEERILKAVNDTGTGPLGFGGKSTCGGVYIKEAPTHIATLPVAVNINCHALRYAKEVL